jgi:replicative DNA helicase
MKTLKASHLLDQGKAHAVGTNLEIRTGIEVLDQCTHGLPVGLVLLAGRHASGHELLARQIALTVSRTGSTPVIWFSTKFSGEFLVSQLLEHADADQVLTDNQALTVIDTPRLTMDMLRTKLNELLDPVNRGRSLVIVDDLEILLKSCSPGPIDQTEIARQIRSIALGHNASLMICCGLSRELEDRRNKSPRLSDLRKVSAFVLESDQVMATYYPYFYEPEIFPQVEWQILILKNRNGCSGGVGVPPTMLPWPPLEALPITPEALKEQP